MKLQTRRGIVSLMVMIGLIFLFLGIFTGMDFFVGLFLAISFWIISGVIGTWLGISEEDEGFLRYAKINHRRGIVSLISGIGVIVLLIGIFLNPDSFFVFLVIAIGIWMFSGVIATFLGVDEQTQEYYEAEPSSPMQSNQFNNSIDRIEEPPLPLYPEPRNQIKKFCPQCGIELKPDDLFCLECGAKIK